MKRTLLALFALAMSGVAFAQTNCSIAENLPTAANVEGFEFKFKRQDPLDKEVLNCLPPGGGTSDIWGNPFGGTPPTAFSFAIHPTDDKLVLTVPTAIGTTTIPCRFPKGNCNQTLAAGLFDLSGADKRIHLKIATTVRCTLSVYLVVLAPGYDEIDGNVANPRPSWVLEANTEYEMCSLLPTFKSTDVDYASYFGAPIGFAFTLKTETDNGTLTFSKFAFGEGATVPAGTFTSSTNEGILDNAAINVYPTPSSDELNVDLSQLSADAELKLVSSNGQTVYTSSATNSLNKINVAEYTEGLYALQITSNGKTTTKKVIIK